MTPALLVQRKVGQVSEMHIVEDGIPFCILFYFKDNHIVDQVCWLRPTGLLSPRYAVIKETYAHLENGKVVKPIYQTAKWWSDKTRYLASDNEIDAKGRPHKVTGQLQIRMKVVIDINGNITQAPTLASKVLVTLPPKESEEIDLVALLAQQASVSDDNSD